MPDYGSGSYPPNHPVYGSLFTNAPRTVSPSSGTTFGSGGYPVGSDIYGSPTPALAYDYMADTVLARGVAQLASSVSDLAVTRASIGLSLDVEVASAGANTQIITGGTFDTLDPAWTALDSQTTLSLSSGRLRVTAAPGFVAGSAHGVMQTFTTVPGRMYAFSLDAVAKSGAISNTLFIANGVGIAGTQLFFANYGQALATQSGVFIATGTQATILLRTAGDWAVGDWYEWDNVSVKEIGAELIANPGGPFTSTTGWTGALSAGTGSAPTLSVVNGNMRVQNDGSGTAYGCAALPFPTVPGRTYTCLAIQAGSTNGVGLNNAVNVGTGSFGGAAYANVANATAGTPFTFVATATVTYINLNASSNNANGWRDFSSVTVKDTSGVTGYLRSFPANVARRVAGYGLLVEEARTNLALWSQDFTNAAYTKGGCAVTKSGIAPDGTATNNLVTEDTTTAAHYFYGTNFSGAATALTISVYVQAGTQRYISLRGDAVTSGTNFPWITLDTQTGAVQSNGVASSYGVKAMGGGVFRLWLTYAPFVPGNNNAVLAGSNVATAPAATVTLGNSYAGTSQTWYAWGLQVEAVSFATSYIPTTTAAAARAADVVALAGGALAAMQGAAGAVIAETSGIQFSPFARILYGNGFARLGTGAAQTTVDTGSPGGAVQATLGGGSFANFVKAAEAWDASGRSVIGNAGTATNSATVTDTGGPIYLGSSGAANFISGYVRKITFYNTRVSDAQLKALTDTVYTYDFNTDTYLEDGVAVAPPFSITRASTGMDLLGTTAFASNTLRKLTNQGVLIEEARTNLCLQSQTLATSPWVAGSGAVTNNVTTAPDGTATASKITEDTSTNVHQAAQIITTAAGSQTHSVYLKAAERTWAWFGSSGSAGADGYINLATGALGTVTGGTAKVQSVGNGWYRLSITYTATAGSTTIFVRPATADTVGTYAGTVGSGIYAWGAQSEPGAFATSYIPTTSAAATRAADNINAIGALLSGIIQGAAGTVLAEVGTVAGGTPSAWQLFDAYLASDPTKRLSLYKNASGTTFAADVGGANPSVAAYAAGAAQNKVAVAFDSAGGVVAANGTVGTPLAGTLVPLDTLAVGRNRFSGNYLNAPLRKLTLYPYRRLSSAELQAATT